MNEIVVECRGVTRRYVLPGRRSRGAEVVALDDVALQIPRGQLVAL